MLSRESPRLFQVAAHLLPHRLHATLARSRYERSATRPSSRGGSCPDPTTRIADLPVRRGVRSTYEATRHFHGRLSRFRLRWRKRAVQHHSGCSSSPLRGADPCFCKFPRDRTPWYEILCTRTNHCCWRPANFQGNEFDLHHCR